MVGRDANRGSDGVSASRFSCGAEVAAKQYERVGQPTARGQCKRGAK